MKPKQTLLDKDTPPTVAELKEQFKKNDYTTIKSKYNYEKSSDAEVRIYLKAKAFFDTAWKNQLKSLGVKDSPRNFSVNYPVNLLEKTNNDLVSGTVIEILQTDDLAEQIIENFFISVEKPLMQEFHNHVGGDEAKQDMLSDIEIQHIVDDFVDKYLNKMMNLMMQSQGVGELDSALKEIRAHEDFNKKAHENHDKIDFDRKWTHSRTKSGAPVSYDELVENEMPIIPKNDDVFDIESEVVCDILLKQYLATLSDTDRKTIELKQQGKTTTEIAEILGYKTHSAIVKRLKKLETELMKIMQ